MNFRVKKAPKPVKKRVVKTKRTADFAVVIKTVA
jgi:hypothetical protein